MNDERVEKEIKKPYVMAKMSKVINMLRIDHSLNSLKEAEEILTNIEENERRMKVEKLLAEVYYLIALEYNKKEERKEMQRYGKMSIDLYKKLNISTLEDSIPFLAELLPDYMHEGVVKSILSIDELKENGNS